MSNNPYETSTDLRCRQADETVGWLVRQIDRHPELEAESESVDVCGDDLRTNVAVSLLNVEAGASERVVIRDVLDRARSLVELLQSLDDAAKSRPQTNTILRATA